MGAEFRLLGPVEVRVGGHPVRLSGPRQRVVLAALLLHANRVVLRHRLVELTWQHAPSSAAANLRGYLSQLRRLLRVPGEPESRLRTREGGYLIAVGPGELDVATFTEQAALGEQATDDAVACDHFARALARWRGRPLENLPLVPALAAEATWLTERRDEVRERYFASRLALGQHQAVLPELSAFVAVNPLRESAVGMLMSALHRVGRRAEALRLFHRTRTLLVEELGVDPGAELRRIHEWLLAAEDEPAPAGPAARGGGTPGAAPTVLPGDLPTFVGRTRQLAALAATLQPDATPRVVAIDGMPGVGKTALAVHAMHHVVSRHHIDVVLSANLLGYDPGRSPLGPETVLDSWLRLLGVSADRVHELDLRGRHEELRARLTGRTVLVLLDNAMSEKQVRPLLARVPRSLTVITSRRRLTALPGARHLRLDVFTSVESLRLLRDIAGADRVDDDRVTAVEIADVVGNLPLAVGLVARRIAHTPGWTLRDHLDRLRQHRATLRVDDGLDAALTVSYERLPAACRRLWRLLAVHPGRDIDVLAAAALAGAPVDDTADHLGTLCAANLLRHTHGRYEFHDLARIYATRHAHDEDPAHDREAGLTRLFTHYVYNSAQAMDRYAPHERHRRPQVTAPDTPAHRFADQHAATRWLNTERPNLVATAVEATRLRWPRFATWLSAILARYLDTGGHYRDAEVVHEHASRTTDPTARAWALSRLSSVHWRTGRYTDTVEVLRAALAVFRDTGDRVGQGFVLGNLGMAQLHLGQCADGYSSFTRSLGIARELAERPELDVADISYERQGRHPSVVDRPQLALHVPRQVAVIARRCGDRLSECNALGDLGIMRRLAGQYDEAHDYLRQALVIAREIGNHAGQIDLLNELGETVFTMGRLERALGHHHAAAALSTELGDRYRHACALSCIARCHQAMGHRNTARTYWQHALELHTILGTPEADDVRHRLSAGR